jgi:hypothetical protein
MSFSRSQVLVRCRIGRQQRYTQWIELRHGAYSPQEPLASPPLVRAGAACVEYTQHGSNWVAHAVLRVTPAHTAFDVFNPSSLHLLQPLDQACHTLAAGLPPPIRSFWAGACVRARWNLFSVPSTVRPPPYPKHSTITLVYPTPTGLLAHRLGVVRHGSHPGGGRLGGVWCARCGLTPQGRAGSCGAVCGLLFLRSRACGLRPASCGQSEAHVPTHPTF